MISVRKSEERGLTDIGWLVSRHTFSFDKYYDPHHMHFRSLRVINEDIVKPGEGFSTHPHNNMEIITYIVSGELAHKDSMENGSVIKEGEVQRMTAGTGIRHSEYNPSADKEVHLLQIWILPDEKELTPSYEQKNFSEMMKEDELNLIASRDGKDGSVVINQDARIYTCRLSGGKNLDVDIGEGRNVWVQVVDGELWVAGEKLLPGDGCSVTAQNMVNLKAKKDCHFLLFDLN